ARERWDRRRDRDPDGRTLRPRDAHGPIEKSFSPRLPRQREQAANGAALGRSLADAPDARWCIRNALRRDQAPSGRGGTLKKFVRATHCRRSRRLVGVLEVALTRGCPP